MKRLLSLGVALALGLAMLSSPAHAQAAKRAGIKQAPMKHLDMPRCPTCGKPVKQKYSPAMHSLNQPSAAGYSLMRHVSGGHHGGHAPVRPGSSGSDPGYCPGRPGHPGYIPFE